ncbi:hypothetical protein, partial [Chromobacterium amazonense]|uniref:hypothetical protein n=1 Tax=Chromobacterium amazonense TaxID=1382803 RepID=UPI003F7ABF59
WLMCCSFGANVLLMSCSFHAHEQRGQKKSARQFDHKENRLAVAKVGGFDNPAALSQVLGGVVGHICNFHGHAVSPVG